MPKKYRIEQKRKWLEQREKGKSEKWIANNTKCDIRTISKGVEEARLEREAGLARIELMKETIRNHQQELLGVIDGIVSMLEKPREGLEIRRDQDKRIAPIPLSGAIVKQGEEDELTLIIQDEDSLKWELLKEHLKGDKLWKTLRQWEDALLLHIRARIALMDIAQRLLEGETGLKLIKKVTEIPESAGIFPTAAQVFYELALRRALSIKDKTNLEERLIATPDGYVRNGPGGTEYAYAPGTQDKCKEKILIALEKLYDSPEVKQVANSCITAGNITKETRTIAEEIRLLGMLPNRCRVCKRLGV